MNDLFKQNLTLVTNNTKPNLSEFLDNFFKANERYEIAKNQSKSKTQKPDADLQSFSHFSETIKSNPFNHCSLCDSSSHGINKCSEYSNPLEKIKQLKKTQCMHKM